MTGRRPDRQPLEAIEIGLRRLRHLGLALLALVVIVPGGHRPDAIGLAILAGLAVLAVTVDRLPERLDIISGQPDRLVAMQIGADVLITVGALVVIDPGPGDGIWLIVAFPVIEGAVRYGVLGGLTVWLSTALPVAGWVIANWAPGDGLSTMTRTGGLLAIALAVGLPAGSVSEQLVAELQRHGRGREDLDRQAELLSVLAVAATDLSTREPRELCRTLVEAGVGLGFSGAELLLVDTATMARHPLASEPTEFTTGDATIADVVGAGLAVPGTVLSGSGDQLAGTVAAVGSTATVLAVETGHRGPWGPRTEAFELLCRLGAAAMEIAGGRLHIAEATRQLELRRANDPVTGLLNRAGFEAAVAAVLDRLLPGGQAQVLAFDFNGSAIAHSAGGGDGPDEVDQVDQVEQVLAEIGGRLRRSGPAGSAVARLDADRFALVTDAGAADHLVRHLGDVLGRPLAMPRGVMTVPVSIGHVLTADPTLAPTSLIGEAELRARTAAAARPSDWWDPRRDVASPPVMSRRHH